MCERFYEYDADCENKIINFGHGRGITESVSMKHRKTLELNIQHHNCPNVASSELRVFIKKKGGEERKATCRLVEMRLSSKR